MITKIEAFESGGNLFKNEDDAKNHQSAIQLYDIVKRIWGEFDNNRITIPEHHRIVVSTIHQLMQDPMNRDKIKRTLEAVEKSKIEFIKKKNEPTKSSNVQ